MLDLALQLAEELDDADGMHAALADWFVIGLHAGLRKSEWAQPLDGQKDPDNPETNQFNDARAFCINDVEIETMNRKRYRGHNCLKMDPNSVRKMWITFRSQKNGENGER